MNLDDKLKEIIKALNEKRFILGPGPSAYDEETVIVRWECGAVVGYKRSLGFISEDDGYWSTHGGLTNGISVGWAKDLSLSLMKIHSYIKTFGQPYRYILGTDWKGDEIYGDICGYELKKEK